MPNKKISDIIPPKDNKDKEIIVPIKSKKKKTVSVRSDSPRVQFQTETSKKTIWWPVLTIFFIVCLIGVSYFLIKPKAEISIWPKKNPLIVKTQIVVGNDIVGEIKTQECPFSQEFAVTGTKFINTKASGTIRVYNAYSTTQQTLIATTRFVSDGGKLFRIPKKIVIPGAHYEGSKLIPGELDTIVEASEAGEEYNISPSTFSLPALAGTSRYTAFYAKSFSPMTGGSKRQTIQVTDEDLSSAEESFSIIALDNCKKTLQDSFSSEEYIFNEEALNSEIIEFDTLARVGQEVEKFTVNTKARVTALVFKKSDLENFAKTYIASKIPEGSQLDENSVNISYSPQDVDLDQGEIVLNIEISSEIYSTINENSIKEAVMSQRPDEIAMSIRQFSEIRDFQVRLWPFWTNKTPFDVEGITIKVRLD